MFDFDVQFDIDSLKSWQVRQEIDDVKSMIDDIYYWHTQLLPDIGGTRSCKSIMTRRDKSYLYCFGLTGICHIHEWHGSPVESFCRNFITKVLEIHLKELLEVLEAVEEKESIGLIPNKPLICVDIGDSSIEELKQKLLSMYPLIPVVRVRQVKVLQHGKLLGYLVKEESGCCFVFIPVDKDDQNIFYCTQSGCVRTEYTMLASGNLMVTEVSFSKLNYTRQIRRNISRGQFTITFFNAKVQGVEEIEVADDSISDQFIYPMRKTLR